MHKPDDGRSDFISGGAGRMDGMPMKPVSSWEPDEATRLKSSMMSREKMASLLRFRFSVCYSAVDCSRQLVLFLSMLFSCRLQPSAGVVRRDQ